jgi:hypothetical protein
MNKLLTLTLICAIAIAATPFARGLGAPETPPGVAADHWIQMGDSAGFVITDLAANDLRKGLRTDPNAVRGYFLVRRGQTWLQVDPTPASAVYQTQLAR